ncbi:MAG: Crp/Fnr family transcriptional regulator [Pseudomonadota bacterium]|uniref:Crp/Fnr family transcriptional regulator n=1 Tax=Fodinicurvata fenggangensis TaxID=1121830 RepID=UPI00047AD0CC|nr:Crp/Fnr family transcriptional regulator [Fodinicurvata fenggangensis]
MEGKADLDVLAGTELFRGLSRQALEDIWTQGFRKQLPTGAALFLQDDSVTAIYVLIAGRLRVTQTTAEGAQVILRYLGPGELAGYTALSGGDSYPGSVTAVEDCHLLGWSRQGILDLMSRHAQVALNSVTVLGRRYQETQLRLRELSTEKVERRIAHTLLRLSVQAGRRTAEGIEIAFPLSRQDLAEMAGTTLHTASRILSTWEKQGLVLSGRRRIMVRQPDHLSTIAESG